MEKIVESIKTIGPLVLAAWVFTIVMCLWKPQKFRNSFFLMGSIGITMIFIATLFGDHASDALVVMFIIVCVALLFVPFLLIANGVQMMKRERRSAANMLSLILGVVIFLGEAAFAVYAWTVAYNNYVTEASRIIIFFGVSVFYICVIILAFVLYSLFMQILPRPANYDFIVIHGCGLVGGKELSPLLKSRVDTAIKYYNKSKTKPVLIPSGGKGGDEEISEAQAMKDYLLSMGIPEEHITLEDQSRTTQENIINCKAIINKKEGKKKVALVSSNYHVYRCLLYAKTLRLKCTGIGAPVAWYYWPSALLREFAAVFTQVKYIIWTVLGYLILVVIPVLCY